MCQLVARDTRVRLGTAVHGEPQEQPDEPERARCDEGPLPTPRERDPGNQERCDNRTGVRPRVEDAGRERDRKSTRLNSSHSQISYAVFCLKKKKQPRLRALQLLYECVPV